MGTKEKIKVCIVENDIVAYQVFEELFKNNKNFDMSIIKAKGNDSSSIERSREDDKAYIMGELAQKSFQILILDLLLRDRVTIDREEVSGTEFSGIENVLSLEIALQMKKDSNRKDFLPVFISSSKICKTHQQFEAIRDKYSDKVPEDAVFIFKPTQGFDKAFFQNCPIDTGTNEPACDKKNRNKRGCPVKQCFFQLLKKYYKDYMEKIGNE